jgi:SulP family sulfate permease
MLKNLFPILSWLPNYNKAQFAKDLPAGITVGIMLVPQGMAYALIAGLPMVYGLYASLIPGIIYALTGTSRQLSVGPVAMDSLLVAAGLATMATAGSESYIGLAIVLALMMGVIQLLLGLFKAGFLVNFLSKPIVSGFTSAAAIIIGANQISNLTGLPIPRNNRIQNFISSLFDLESGIHWPTLLMGLLGITVLILFKKINSNVKIPAALIVVVIGILIAWGLNLETEGLSVVGNIPEGLPSFSIPKIDKSIASDLLPVAITLALVAFMEAYSVAKAVEEKHDYKIDANQELKALGLSNIIGSIFQSYPTTGGFSRTAVNDDAGAVTPMSSTIASAVIGLTLLFLTPLFYHLPKSILAAIIIVAVSGLIDFKTPISLWKVHKLEAALLVITFITTLSVGMVEGIGTGVVISIIVLVHKQMRPHFTELGEVQGLYRNITRFPEARIREDVLIMRFDSALHFANHRFLHNSINELLQGRNVSTVILCAEAIVHIDASGIHSLEDLINDLEKRGIDFRLAAAKGPVRDVIKASKLIAKIGKTHCYTSIKNAITDLDNPGTLGENVRKVATQTEIKE